MFDESKQLWIHISGLPSDFTEGDLVCVLSEYGEILELSCSRNDDDKFTGSCFIKYESSTNCDRAVHYLHGFKLFGNKLDVIHADKLFATREKSKGQVDENVPATNEKNDSSRIDRSLAECKLASEDDLITHIRDEQLSGPDCLSNHVGLSPIKDDCEPPTPRRTHSREENRSSSSPSRNRLKPQTSSSTPSSYSSTNHNTRSSNSVRKESTKNHHRSPDEYDSDRRRYKDSYSSPRDDHRRQSPLSQRSSPSHSRRRRSRSPSDRLIATRSNSPGQRTSTSRSYHRDTVSPLRHHHSSRASPYSRRYDDYHRYDYNHHDERYDYYHHHRTYDPYVYTESRTRERDRRSTSRRRSVSPRRRDRSRSRDRYKPESRHRSSSKDRYKSESRRRSTSKDRYKPESRHRSRTSRSPSCSRRVSSTSHARSSSAQREGSSGSWRGYCQRKMDERNKSLEKDRKCDGGTEGVGPNGISKILQKRLSQHFDANGT